MQRSGYRRLSDRRDGEPQPPDPRPRPEAHRRLCQAGHLGVQVGPTAGLFHSLMDFC